MLSITGKSYSKIQSENPFYEDPLPKAYYHPTPQKHLHEAEKQLALSSKQAGEQKQQDAGQSAERAFLAGSHAIKALSAVQNHAPKSPRSSNFDESWPDSERPSSPSVTAGEDRSGLEPLPYASVRKHALPAFTSSPISDGGAPRHPLDHFLTSRSPLAPGQGASGPGESAVLGRGGEMGKMDSGRGKDCGGGLDAAEKGSVLQRYIERFRHGAPMSREERVQADRAQKEFWWLESGPPTPNSTSTPKEHEGRSLPFTSQGRGALTVENLRKRDGFDTATADLQEKAERLLTSAKSVGSSEPVVSTEGLGSTGSDVTGSSFSEAVVRPMFLPRGGGFHPKQGLAALDRGGGGGWGGPGGQEDDILFKWRLQRKLDSARDARYTPTDTAHHHHPPLTAADREVHSRLTSFKEKLLQRGSVVSTQLEEARVEKAMKQVQSVMDTGVQTSPIRTPSSSSSQHPPGHTPSWSYAAADKLTVDNSSSTGPDRRAFLQAPHQRDQGQTSVSRQQQQHQRQQTQQRHSSPKDVGGMTTVKFTQDGKGVEMVSESAVRFSDAVATRERGSENHGKGVDDTMAGACRTAENRPDSGSGNYDDDQGQDSSSERVAERLGSAKRGSVPESKAGGRSSVRYTQYLEAEKPHVSDGGDAVMVEELSAPDKAGRPSSSARHGSAPSEMSGSKHSSSRVSPRDTITTVTTGVGGGRGGGGGGEGGGGGDASFHDAGPSDAARTRVKGLEPQQDWDSNNSCCSSWQQSPGETEPSQHQQQQQGAPGRRGGRGQSKDSSAVGERDEGFHPDPRHSYLDSREGKTGKAPGNKQDRFVDVEGKSDQDLGRVKGRPHPAAEVTQRSRGTPPGGDRSQQRSGGDGDRSQERSGVVPSPLHSSSPARTPLSSAIGRVVQDRMFDVSGSLVSSVDSFSSLQRSAASPLLPHPPLHPPAPLADCECESDGEFEDDTLLEVLRQQRHIHETQLRLLDMVLAEREES